MKFTSKQDAQAFKISLKLLFTSVVLDAKYPPTIILFCKWEGVGNFPKKKQCRIIQISHI